MLRSLARQVGVGFARMQFHDRAVRPILTLSTTPLVPATRGGIVAEFAAVHMSAPVQVFGRRQRRSNHALIRQASEKRQGTKSRQRVCGGSAAGYGDLAAGSGVRVMKRDSGEADFVS